MKFESISNLFNKNKAVDNSKLDEVLAGIDCSRFRIKLLTDEEKVLISKLVNSGKNVDLDAVQKVIGKERTRAMHWDSLAIVLENKNNAMERRRLELLSLGKDKEPFILDDGKINIVDIHGINPDNNQEEVNLGLPGELDKNIIRVGYQEQTSSDTDEPVVDDSGVINMVDASGKMSSNYLKGLFNSSDNSSFIMTGGNLRGCFLESLNGIIKQAKKVETSKVDFHVLLDKCYDNNSYDKVTPYKDLQDAILRTATRPSEVYEDGELVAAVGEENELDSKFRFYIWKETAMMINKIMTQFENKKNDLDFEAMLEKQKENDEKNLLEARESLNSKD